MITKNDYNYDYSQRKLITITITINYNYDYDYKPMIMIMITCSNEMFFKKLEKSLIITYQLSLRLFN